MPIFYFEVAVLGCPPLRAKIVAEIKELNKYPYSGHSVLTGNKKRKWCDTQHVLSYFGK